jgi:hypothetical protein
MDNKDREIYGQQAQKNMDNKHKTICAAKIEKY